MSRTLRLQLFNLAQTLIGTLVLLRLLAGRAPAGRYALAAALPLAFVAAAALSLAWRRRGLARERDTAEHWFGHTLALMLASDLAFLGFFWLLMPFAEPALLVLTAFAFMAVSVAQFQGTVQAARRGARGALATWLPLVLPAGQMLYFLAHPARFAWLLLLAVPLATGMLWLFREGMQAAFDASHAARREAERERDARTRFLAAASHDLGQPLQSARLFLDAALHTADPAQRERAGRGARDALGAMAQQLGQILDHLRLESGSIAPEPAEVALGPVIARVSSRFEPAAALAGARLIAVHSRCRVRADPRLLERALGNLVDNALRHADARRVLIGVHGGRLWVIDDGRGVAAADRPRLFEEFVQGGDTGGRERGGFGLGLASVRRLMALTGGRAGIAPGWRRGSAFFLEFSG